jgi:hypothetical protein
MLTPEVLSAAAAALGARSVTQMGDLTTSGRSTVVRLGVTGGEAATAILKLGGDHVMANWCGLAFLDAVAPGAGPRLLAGDRGLGFVLMEDLGAGPSLKSALAGADPIAAEGALIAHATALGNLAAATRGRLDDYARLVVELDGPETLLGPQPSETMLTDCWAIVQRELPALGLRAAPAVADDVEVLCGLWGTPAAALSFSPGDSCPDNHVLAGATVRFFDVDFCSFHPTALDGAYHARPHLPSCNYLAELPPDVADRARQAFARCVEVDDAELHVASAAWTVLNAGWLLSQTLAGDRSLGPTTFRQMLLWRLRATAERCRAVGSLTRLGGLLDELGQVLGERWPDVGPMPLYPAFQGAAT